MLRKTLLLLLLVIPIAQANTAEIPALEGSGIQRFKAASYSGDGASIPAGSTQFFPMFGDSAPRNTETDLITPAALAYNATGLRVRSNTAGCGGLAGEQTFTFTFRVNQVDTALSVVCTSATAAGTLLYDSDIVAVSANDSLSFKVVQAGAVLGVALRVGVTMEGYRTLNITTEPVPDMVNEMLETVNVILPLIAFILVIIWAEITRELFVYILALVTGATAVIALWPDVVALRIILVASLPLVAMRGWTSFEEQRMEQE